ncbi:hypothetical protein OEZ60_13250 [Defluviimonas sp. WL0024]|uniref:Uncharacterized protein n=2 Tax=Albidovulum TaxID=205889 RepID=A0ABT3J9G2_9RHOB|nr:MULTISPECIES: hypothetical protein [Defluviimonas]MCU9848970.1 hypothetical protein [Defluviimonas sp. WL0024]MCW3784327.1 hypothetical protein [Defluviimonas salinarum]
MEGMLARLQESAARDATAERNTGMFPEVLDAAIEKGNRSAKTCSVERFFSEVSLLFEKSLLSCEKPDPVGFVRVIDKVPDIIVDLHSVMQGARKSPTTAAAGPGRAFQN